MNAIPFLYQSYDLQKQTRRLLIVLFHRLEECLRMCTCRAALRSGLAFVYITTVAALPEDLLITREDITSLNVSQQFAITNLVLLLNGSYIAENGCDCGETLLLCNSCEFRIHFSHSSFSPAAAAAKFSIVVPILPAG